MDEGYDNDEGGHCRGGGKGGGRVSGKATTVAAAPIANEVLVSTSGRSQTSNALLLSSSRPPRYCQGRGGTVGYLYLLSWR